MTSPHQQASSRSATATPWYDLLPDPQPPEDHMQQEDTIVQVLSILKARYESDPTVLCVSQTDIIYDSNVPGSMVAPDGFIVFGVDARPIRQIRNSYRIDEWGRTPVFVLEVASESTASRDLREKRENLRTHGRPRILASRPQGRHLSGATSGRALERRRVPTVRPPHRP